jgi:transcription elongation factor Elf1
VCGAGDKRKNLGRDKKMNESQGCMYCGKWLSVKKGFSGLVYCSVCGKDGRKRKREYKEK